MIRLESLALQYPGVSVRGNCWRALRCCIRESQFEEVCFARVQVSLAFFSKVWGEWSPGFKCLGVVTPDPAWSQLGEVPRPRLSVVYLLEGKCWLGAAVGRACPRERTGSQIAFNLVMGLSARCDSMRGYFGVGKNSSPNTVIGRTLS